MKTFWIVAFALLNLQATSAWADSVHKVAKNETLWFLSQLYYDDGGKVAEILKANHLKKPEDLVVGEDVVIPNPKFSNKESSFPERYRQMLETRKQQKSMQKATATTSEKATAQNSLFMRKDLGSKSARESAEDELKRSSSADSGH